MLKHFRQIFEDETGRLSSTRILGSIAMLSGLYLNAAGKLPAASQALTIACALLGIGQVKSAVIKGVESKAKAPPTEKKTNEKENK